jgi:putative IMPACT (imprinted ancient) family translation regulator
LAGQNPDERAAVSLYYGGVTVGTGGLVRAYSSSVQQAIKLVRTRKKVPMTTMLFTVPYRFLTTVKKNLEEADTTITHE